MKKKMSLLCPSRGRPNDLERFILSVTDTAADPGRVEILVYVDDDDPLKFDYILKHKSLSLERNVQSPMNMNVFFDEPLSTMKQPHAIYVAAARTETAPCS